MDNKETVKGTTIEDIADNSESSKRDITTFVLSVLSLLISFATLVATIWIQFYFTRSNPVAKANAGDIKAQYFLAEHYYELGEYEESILWNKQASSAKGKKGADAKNNLAVLYILVGVEGKETQICKLFEDAMALGNVEAGKNLYAWLKQTPKEKLKRIAVDDKLSKAKEFLEKENAFDDEMSKLDDEWEYMSTETGESVPRDNDNYSFVTDSSDYVYNIDGTGFHWVFTYSVYKTRTEVISFAYIYSYRR